MLQINFLIHFIHIVAVDKLTKPLGKPDFPDIHKQIDLPLTTPVGRNVILSRVTNGINQYHSNEESRHLTSRQVAAIYVMFPLSPYNRDEK